MSDITCPYCEKDMEARIDEPAGQDGTHEIECSGCNKIFMVTENWSVYYSPFPTPCKNDDNKCEYEKVGRYPLVIYGKVCIRCKWCNHEKDAPWEKGLEYGYSFDELVESSKREAEQQRKLNEESS